MYQIHSRNTFVEHRTFLYDVQQVERIEFFHMMVVSRIDSNVNSWNDPWISSTVYKCQKKWKMRFWK